MKINFTYQLWYPRIFGIGLLFPILFLAQFGLFRLFNIEGLNFGFFLISVGTALLLMFIYYKVTDHFKWFVRNGSYTVDSGIVRVELKSGTYEVKNVKWLNGTTVSAYGFAKSGMLVVKFEDKKLMIVSPSNGDLKSFADCELFPLFEAILESNEHLQKDDTFDFWYEEKSNDNFKDLTNV